MQQRVEQASLLQPKKNRSGAQERAEAAIAQLYVWTAGRFFADRIAKLTAFFAPALEDTQDISGLRGLPSRQRFEKGKYAFLPRLFRSGGRPRLQPLRCSGLAIALAKVRIFKRV